MIQGAELSRQANQSMQNTLENMRIRGEAHATVKADLLKSKVPVKAPPSGPPTQTTRESSQREEASTKAAGSIGKIPIKAPPPQLSPTEQKAKEERRKQEESAKERAPSQDLVCRHYGEVSIKNERRRTCRGPRGKKESQCRKEQADKDQPTAYSSR